LPLLLPLPSPAEALPDDEPPQADSARASEAPTTAADVLVRRVRVEGLCSREGGTGRDRTDA